VSFETAVMSPSLSAFIDSLDRAIDEAADGRLTHGRRFQLIRKFDAEFGQEASRRRDLVAAIVAREMYKSWDPHWLAEASSKEANDEHQLVAQFPGLFEKALQELVQRPPSDAMTRFAEWRREYRYHCDYLEISMEAKGVLFCCSCLASRNLRLDEDWCREICSDNEWNQIDEIDAEYHFESDDGPWYTDDAWELLQVLPNRYDPVETLAPTYRKAWRWWLDQVRLVATDFPAAQALFR